LKADAEMVGASFNVPVMSNTSDAWTLDGKPISIEGISSNVTSVKPFLM
jgi:hypothetical protein